MRSHISGIQHTDGYRDLRRMSWTGEYQPSPYPMNAEIKVTNFRKQFGIINKSHPLMQKSYLNLRIQIYDLKIEK